MRKALGFENDAHMIAMVSGLSAMPFRYIQPVAELLKLDPAYLARVNFNEIDPDMLTVIDQIYADAPLLTAGERALIACYRNSVGIDGRPAAADC
jgi:hypothetical protein